MIIERSLDVTAAASNVYRISQDYAVRYCWDPFPEKIELVGGDSMSVGTVVRIVAKSGWRMEVKFVQLSAPSVAAVVMTKGPVFLGQFAGSWQFRARGENLTTVKFRYLIKLKKWALPWLFEKLVAIYFDRIVQQRIAGLKRYCESHTSI